MADSYENLLNEILSNSVKDNSVSLLPDELQIQAHWFAGHLGSRFITSEGEKVIIKQFGFWNKSAGPDFLNCCVEVDGKNYEGAIEIDHSPTHWELHGHHLSERFENVILHVSFSRENATRFIRTKSNKFIPQVCVDNESLHQALGESCAMDITSLSGRCSTPFETISPQAINQILTLAAKHRIKQKASLADKLKNTHGADQAKWVQLAETMGYKNNTLNFHVLAQRIPIAELKKFSNMEIQAILFGVSNFLHPDLHKSAPEDSREWLEQLWETWWKLRQRFEFSSERILKWNLSGIRPVNHPQRRIAALVSIASNWETFSNTSDDAEILKLLTSLEDSFWNFHYTLNSKTSSKFLKLVGESRANDFVTNHSLPQKIMAENPGSWESYQSLKPPAISEKVNRAADRLFGMRNDKPSFIKKSWQHQALLQIYQDFCLEHIAGCEDCPFPEQLKDWANRRN